MTKLIAPKDASSTTFKGKEYPVKDGQVDVPQEAVASLLSHGFTRPQPPAPKPLTTADKLKAEKDAKAKADADAKAAAEALAAQHAAEDKAAEEGDAEAIAAVTARLTAKAETAKGAEKTGILAKLEKLAGLSK